MFLEHCEICKGLIEKGQILPQSQDMFFDYENLIAKFEKRRIINLNTINVDSNVNGTGKVLNILSKQIGSFQGHIDLLCDSLRNWKKKGNRIIVLSGTRGRGERLCEELRSKGIEAAYMDLVGNPVAPGQIIVTHGSLNKGFEYPSIGFVILSDKEVFGQDRRPYKKSGKHMGSRIDIFTNLNLGDFVVHQSHGIGQYIGIEKLAV